MFAELLFVFIVGTAMGLIAFLHFYFVPPDELGARAIWNAHSHAGLSTEEIAAMSGYSRRQVRKTLDG